MKEHEPVCAAFAELLTEMRVAEHWSRGDLAERARVAEEMIRKVELMLSVPTLEVAKLLCRAFQVRLGPALVEAERRCGEFRATGRPS